MLVVRQEKRAGRKSSKHNSRDNKVVINRNGKKAYPGMQEDKGRSPQRKPTENRRDAWGERMGDREIPL